MSEQLIIGLYSPAQQSGKSSVANILRSEYGFEVRGFATALKRMVTDLLFSAGYDPVAIGRLMNIEKEVPIPELGGKSFRYLAQTIGTEWGRELVDQNLWVNIVLKNQNRPDLLVIDDVRFPNEYHAIKEEGGQVWRIYRPGQEPSTDHPSEGLLEGYEFDEEITNDGTFAELQEAVIGALTGPV